MKIQELLYTRYEEYCDELQTIEYEYDPDTDKESYNTVFIIRSNIYGYFTGSQRCNGTYYPTWHEQIYKAKMFKTKSAANNKLLKWAKLRECGCEVLEAKELFDQPVELLNA